jgi:hypothetical protein
MRKIRKCLCVICGKNFEWHFKKNTCSKECTSKLIKQRRLESPLVFTEEGIQKLREIHVGNKNPMCHITEEERKEISERYSGDNNPNRKYNPELLRAQHDKIIDDVCKELETDGYKTVPVGKWKTPHADIIAFKDGKAIAYEITSHYPEKYKWDNFPIFDDIIWIRFKKDKSCSGYIFGARLKTENKI